MDDKINKLISFIENKNNEYNTKIKKNDDERQRLLTFKTANDVRLCLLKLASLDDENYNDEFVDYVFSLYKKHYLHEETILDSSNSTERRYTDDCALIEDTEYNADDNLDWNANANYDLNSSPKIPLSHQTLPTETISSLEELERFNKMTNENHNSNNDEFNFEE